MMGSITNGIMYFLSFKVYVMLPVIIFILALVFRIKISTAVSSALQLGIGFVGIFIVFDFLVKIVNPAITAMTLRIGRDFPVLDTGWVPLSVITWQFKLAPLLLVFFLAINGSMLALRWTRSVDIDIFNYWHVIWCSVMFYAVTGNTVITIAGGAAVFVLTLKLSDWSAAAVNRFSGMSGICIPHLASLSCFPIGVIGNAIIDRIPGVNKFTANPDKIKEKLGIAGDPMVLGFILGAALAAVAGFSFKEGAELAVSFAAVIYILPKMAGILGSALIPVSDGMKSFLARKFPSMSNLYIGLDPAVLVGIPSVVVTNVLLIPVALILAFTLPGITFVPMGDLTNMSVLIAFICLACNGNIIRTFILSVPMIAANLYMASWLAPFVTTIAANAGYYLDGWSGMFNASLDGGNPLRGWLVYVLRGSPVALALIPVGLCCLCITRHLSKKEDARSEPSCFHDNEKSTV